VCGFLGLASKSRSTVSPSSVSKPVATVSPNLASKPMAMVLVVWPQNHSLWFHGLGLKTGSCSLVIWLTKSPRWFFGLGLKTLWAMVFRLRYKPGGRMKTMWGMRRDLVACFTWKQVRLGFPSLALRLAEVQHGWCMWHHHGGRVQMKP
jgi:hypothetical protein